MGDEPKTATAVTRRGSIGSAIRWGTFTCLMLLPAAMAWSGDPRGPVTVSLLISCPFAVCAGWIRWRLGRSDAAILAAMEAERLQGLTPPEGRPYGPGESAVDPCPVARRLSERRNGHNHAVLALTLMTLPAVLFSTGSAHPPAVIAVIFVTCIIMMFLMTIGVRLQHSRTSHLTGQPAWYKIDLDPDASHKGSWFQQVSQRDLDSGAVERMVLWFVYFVGLIMLAGAYYGKLAPGTSA